MRLYVDVEKINSNLKSLSTEVESFSNALSSYSSATINCPLQELSGILDSYKESIGNDLDKLNTSSHEYNTLVEECCSEYQSNENKTQTINIDKIEEIIKNNTEITSDYKGNASNKLNKIQTLEYTNSNKVTDVMQSVAQAAINNSGGGYDNNCQIWAENVWQNATGIQKKPVGTAYETYLSYGVSTSKENIPVGAFVFGSGASTTDGINNPAGHVGIYVGDGMVADQGGVVTLDKWLSWQKANCDGHQGWIGWGWQNGIDLTKA